MAVVPMVDVVGELAAEAPAAARVVELQAAIAKAQAKITHVRRSRNHEPRPDRNES